MNRESLQNDAETAFRIGLDGRQAMMWTALPAIVTKVNFSAMTIECQPAIQGIITLPDESEQKVNLPLLVDVPIVFPSAGGFTLTFPIQVNDEVLVVFSSRCIDSWWQQGNVQPPLETRMHDLSDGFAILGPKSQPNVIGSISSTKAQLRSNDGTTYLEITSSGKINLVCPSGLGIQGDVSVTGSITSTGEVTGNGIALSTHTHSVTTAPGTTSPPL